MLSAKCSATNPVYDMQTKGKLRSGNNTCGSHETVTSPHCIKIAVALGGHFLEVNEI